MASPRSSPYRGGMPKNYDSGSSSETDSGICLTLMEKKLRSTALKSKSKVFGTCALCEKVITGETQRVEIAIPNTVQSRKFVLKYDKNGVAKLHCNCWKIINNEIHKRGTRRYSKSIKSPTNTSDVDPCSEHVFKIGSVEKCILKEVKHVAEFYDSMVTVGWEAIRIARMIKSSSHCIVFTGAGISTAAGIGDYRGKAGKWTCNDLQDFINDMSLTNNDTKEESDGTEGVDYEVLRPTYTHEAIKLLIDRGYIKYIISQNGDGLHKLSGVKKDTISELHGNVFDEYCENSGCNKRFERCFYTLDDISGEYYDEVEDYGKSNIILPKHAQRCKRCGLNHRTGRYCTSCGGHLIDTIINFGDHLEPEIMERAERHAEKADMIISLGSTMAVTPANSLVSMNKNSGLVICNRQRTEFDHYCNRINRLGEKAGSRVYTNCDILMKCIMSLLLNTNDLIKWEGEREERMRKYNNMRYKVPIHLATRSAPDKATKSVSKSAKQTSGKTSKQTSEKSSKQTRSQAKQASEKSTKSNKRKRSPDDEHSKDLKFKKFKISKKGHYSVRKDTLSSSSRDTRSSQRRTRSSKRPK